jgi:AcrR family transcriptional regulator
MAQKKTAGKKTRIKRKVDTYHHGDLKASLLETAIELLKTRHPSELSLRELAREAGVSQTAPYRHFKNKEELFAALGQQGFEIQNQYMLEAWLKYQDNPLNLYLQCGLSYFRMGLQHPQHFKLMFGSPIVEKEKHPEFLLAASKTFVLLRNMIQLCQKHNVIGAGDPYHKAINCWAVVHGYTNLFTECRFEWLGMTSEKAESALLLLLRQYLDGDKTPLQSSKEDFRPFQTEYSRFFKEVMDKIPEVY